MTRVVVVGGGIAGSSAALRLHELRPDLEVVLLEAAPRLGGKLAVAEVGGVTTDVGAEAVLARRPEGVELIDASGLAADREDPLTLGARLWNRGSLVPLPRGLMGVPGDVSDTAGVLSDGGLERARAEVAAPPLEADVSVGDLVSSALGEEVVARLVEPMLGGVYAGHAHRISAHAATPGLYDRLREGGSVTSAAAEATAPTGKSGPVFAGVRGGVGRLPVAAAQASGAEVRTGATVRSLTRTTDGWALVVGSARDPEQLLADAVVLATPATPTARLLDQVAPDAVRQLATVDYASMAVVTLAVPDVTGLIGSGFLVPPVEAMAVKGATYSFAKWGWVAEAGRDHDLSLLRCSIGRQGEEAMLQRTDEELVAAVVDDLQRITGLDARPVDTHVQRWGGGIPQYAVGHVDMVAAIRAALAGVPRLAVCGAAYDGVGVPAVIGSARLAVDKVLADLGPHAQTRG